MGFRLVQTPADLVWNPSTGAVLSGNPLELLDLLRSPEAWGKSSPENKNKAIEEYLAQLAADAAAYAGVAAPATV